MVSLASIPPSGWFRVQILVGTKIFLFSKTPRQALFSSQAFVSGVLGFFSGIHNART
jgi:hypothetical protein